MLTIATFNLCNLGADAPPGRLARLGAIIANELNAPDVVALQEVMAESSSSATGPIPADAAYLALIAAITAAGGPQYAFREVPPLAHQDGGMAGANIRVGLLFDPARVTFPDRGCAGPEDRVGIRFSDRQPSLTLNPGRIEPIHPAFAGDDCHHWVPSRKALAAEFMVGERRLFVIACHFKSMRSATRREEDYAKQQRHAQAKIVHDFAADLLACDPQAAIVVLGDINDVPGSKTLKLLKGERFHNLLEDLPPGQCYTRRHGDQPQALDHILVSPALRRGAAVRIAHINSDLASGHPEPASDHDPVVATLPALNA
ncbi:MAG TPA: endonuclease/exonuclease/phosphatase family protein [Candidatus Competibacteraceae bacterium]|nr:endonuclease/exonuclease/phosphatase family protein [Candidatus Competibacteraceae bacterium]HRZ04755.1 endonuclease/exonuclease/phosphatase family protein [Candidatus Competibacteraceae bacterium]HSA47004.1 endonuclease/exonuclease/phosphatase family protein [Candidatus Competibacteraceae bacterium]